MRRVLYENGVLNNVNTDDMNPSGYTGVSMKLVVRRAVSDMPIEHIGINMMKISGKEDVLKRKTYTLVKVSDKFIPNLYYGFLAEFLELSEKGCKTSVIDDEGHTLLFFREKEKMSHSLKEIFAIDVMEEISKENDNFNLIEDYDLWYVGPPVFGRRVEDIFLECFNDDVLELRRRACYLMNDRKIDIKVFIRDIGPQGIDENEWISPIDIRNLDINRTILDILKKESTSLMCNDPENFVTEFECVSENIQSQHFLTLFHSNTALEADPVNIFQFVISAYVLPGFVNKDCLVKMPREKLVKDNVKDKLYLLDSIHFHSDMYFDTKEFEFEFYCLLHDLLDVNQPIMEER